MAKNDLLKTEISAQIEHAINDGDYSSLTTSLHDDKRGECAVVNITKGFKVYVYQNGNMHIQMTDYYCGTYTPAELISKAHRAKSKRYREKAAKALELAEWEEAVAKEGGNA